MNSASSVIQPEKLQFRVTFKKKTIMNEYVLEIVEN